MSKPCTVKNQFDFRQPAAPCTTAVCFEWRRNVLVEAGRDTFGLQIPIGRKRKMMTARTTAILLCASAIAMLASWLSIPLLMWDHLKDQDFSELVQHPMWIPVNVTLLIATVLLLPGMAGLFANLSKGGIRRHGVALIVTQFGVAWYACIQFYETFLWPLIARHSPELFDAVGFSASDPLVFGQLVASGLVWSLGFGLTGVMIYRNAGMKWTGIGLAVGAILFGIGMALPIRTVGLVLFSAALAALAAKLWRDDDGQQDRPSL